MNKGNNKRMSCRYANIQIVIGHSNTCTKYNVMQCLPSWIEKYAVDLHL